MNIIKPEDVKSNDVANAFQLASVNKAIELSTKLTTLTTAEGVHALSAILANATNAPVVGDAYTTVNIEKAITIKVCAAILRREVAKLTEELLEKHKADAAGKAAS